MLLKIDAQGYELEVIRGAGAFMKNVQVVQLELSVKRIYIGAPDWCEAIAYMKEEGLAVTGLFPVEPRL